MRRITMPKWAVHVVIDNIVKIARAWQQKKHFNHKRKSDWDEGVGDIYIAVSVIELSTT